MSRLKDVAHLVSGQSPPSDQVHPIGSGIPFLQGNAEFGPVSPSARYECNSASKFAKPGDLLVSVRAPVGAVNVADRQYGIGRGLCAVRPRDVEAGFLRWWAVQIAPLLNSLATGSTFTAVTTGTVGSLEVPDMSRARQCVIADYLDRETAQIDALIGKQERLIETLKERRAAVVDAAFLESSATRRTRVSHLLSHRPSYGVLVPAYVDDNAGVPFVRVGDLRRLDEATELPRISPEQSFEFRRTRLDGGEVLLGVVGHMGKAVVAPSWLRGANVARAVAVLRCRPDVDAWLLTRWIGSRHFLDQAALATGSDTAQPTLGMADLTSFSVHWPVNPDEQRRIADYLDEQTAKIDALIAKAERFIELSKERRAALITAAVTGQIDVREAV